MVVACGEDAQVVARGDGCAVHAVLVANGSGVASDGCLLDIVTGFTTDDEALVADDGVDCCGRAFEQVDEGTHVEGGLLEVEVELAGEVLGVGLEGAESLNLEALGNVLLELKLGVKCVEGRPGERAGDACCAV